MNTDQKLFKSAVIEALSKQHNSELASCREDVSCSRDHYIRMSEITGIKLSALMPKRKNVRKTVVAILIAAALLLAGCTAYIYRNEIRNFIEEFYETYIKVSYSEEQMNNDSYIEEYYSLSYVPEGYEFVLEKKNSLYMKHMWESASGDTIVFEQMLIDMVQYAMDSEEGKTQIISYNGKNIYCLIENEWHRYLWNDGIYALSISSNIELQEEELQQILEGIVTCD